MSVPIAGILLDPYGEVASFAEIKFITFQGAGEVMTTAPAVYKTSADGSYSMDIQFGVFIVQMRYNQSNGKFQQIKKVIVNSNTVATTLGELLLNNEPLTPPEIAYVEQLVAEAKEYRDESEAFAIASEASAQNSATSAAESAQSAIDAANSAALIAPIPLNGGVWASGQTYDFYNQYMIYNGEAYSPLPATTLPYTVGAIPDLGFVYQIKLNSLQLLSGLNEPSDLDRSYRRAVTVAEIENGDFHEGSRLTVTDRGDAPFNVVSGGTPNGGGVLDAGGGNTAILSNQEFAANFNFGAKANPIDYGVTYGDGLTQAQREVNSARLQECFDAAGEVVVKGKIETYGEVLVRSNFTLRGLNNNTCQIEGHHPTEATLTDSTITAPDDQNNNTRELTIERLGISSINADAIYITPFQSKIRHCKIYAANGAGIRHHDGGYQVENEYYGNYFNTCKNGILAPGGFRNATDQFWINNYFFGNGVQDRGIDVTQPSGSIMGGNHFYGGANMEFIRAIGGSLVDITDNFFEPMDNPRIRIELGNPSTYSLKGNRYWRGDGANYDYLGNESAIISLAVSPFNPGKITMTGEIFEQGINNVPIFSLLNGSASDLRNTKVEFDKSNILNGDYSLAAFAASGTAETSHFIQSDHPEFFLFDTTQSPNLYGLSFSEYFQENTADATGFPSLPGNNAWLTNKELVVNNTSSVHSMSFNAGGGPATITGLSTVPPLTRVKIIARAADYFIYKG